MIQSTQMMINLNQVKAASMVLRSMTNAFCNRILEMINENPGITVKEIYKAMFLEQSVVSLHLGSLRRSGFVRTVREGHSIHYYADHENINMMRPLVQQLATYFKGAVEDKMPLPVSINRMQSVRRFPSADVTLLASTGY